MSREWPLNARTIAVLGAENVALDIARMLAKPAEEQLRTEIAGNVFRGLAVNQATDIHVFARRRPAQIKFTPMEFRELSDSPSVDVIVHPDGFEIDAASQREINASESTRLVVDTLMRYLEREPTGAARRIHTHLCQSPVAILGAERVEGLRTERTDLIGDGTIRGTSQFSDWPVEAVYRAVGYLSSHLAKLPFDHHAGVVPHEAGRVLDLDGVIIEATYVSGWLKRGPVGLIGHTKSDAAETIASLLADLPSIPPPEDHNPQAILTHLSSNGVSTTPPGKNGKGATRTRSHSAPRRAASASRSCLAMR